VASQAAASQGQERDEVGARARAWVQTLGACGAGEQVNAQSIFEVGPPVATGMESEAAVDESGPERGPEAGVEVSRASWPEDTVRAKVYCLGSSV